MRRGPGPARRGARRGVVLSVGVHVLLLAAVWWIGSATETMPTMRVYAVDLVSPPPAVEGEPAPLEAEPEPEADPEPTAPDPEPTEPEPAPEATRQPEPRPDPPREPRPAEPRPEPTPPAGPQPDPASPGGEDLRVRTEGVECPSAGYCANMTRVITHTWRRLRPPAARRERAEVFFYIERDGSVSELRLIQRSGNRAFDLSAMEAVEIAGRERLFGPLPDGFGRDRLPVIAPFSPDMLR